MTLPVGMVLVDRYRIDSLLAQGGMGAIYKAFDTNLNIAVAIKENFFQTPESIQQFQQEALILARLRHPGLPRVIHHFSAGTEPLSGRKQYLVMDYIEGEDLWEIVKKQGRPLEERQALNYMTQVCDAVSYLHRQHPPIIHRDIKPQNIKITPDNRAVLVDFGIAKIGDEETKTRVGARGVTPGFSPPEQYSGAGTTPVSDVYSLGATLYAVLTGKKPPDSISLLVSKAKFEPPNVVNSALSNQVSEAVLQAMQPMAEDRPQSVAAWEKILQTTLTSLDTTPTDDDEETLVPGTVLAADIEPSAGERAVQSASTKFWLVDSTGKGYPLGSEPLVIGRHAGADIVVGVLSVSRQHALIRAEGDHCLVMDNGSANGTFLNSQRLGLQWHPMKPGDVLMVGSARFDLTSNQPDQVVSPKPAPGQGGESKTVFDPSAPLVAPVTSEMAAPVQVVPPRQPSPPLPPVHAASPAAAVAQPVQPKEKKRKLLLPIVMVVIILAGLVGAVAFFLFGSTASSSATATAVAQQALMVAQTETAEATELEAKATMTAQAEAETKATASAEAIAITSAENTRQADEENTVTAEAITTKSTPAESTPTTAPTSTPTPTSTQAPPTPTPTEQATPTILPATATPVTTPTPTPPPVPAGPTIIPLKSDVSVAQIGVREVTDVDINLKNPREVYALVKGDGIYKSSIGGEGPWAKIDLDASAVTSLVIDPTNPARLFASTWNAVLRSDDGGNTWKAFGNGLSNANRVVDVVAIDPAAPNILYAGIGETLVVSTDGGETWLSEEYGNGLTGGKFTQIVVDPFNHDFVYAAGEFGSIYKSVDSGRNFIQLPYGTGRGTYSLVPHPTQNDVYLAGINSFDAGIIKTDNGGDFVSVSNGLVFGGADSAYSAIVYAPSNPNIVYAGSGYEDDRFAKGIFKSTNGGKEWERVSDGLNINSATGQPHYVKAIAVHPTNPDIAFAATGGGLFKTIDGGANWNSR